MNLAIITATSSLTDKEEKKVIILPFASQMKTANYYITHIHYLLVLLPIYIVHNVRKRTPKKYLYFSSLCPFQMS